MFIDERDALSFFGQQVQRLSSSAQAPRQVRALQRSAQSIDRAAVSTAARTIRTRTAAGGKAAQPFSVGPFIKLALVVFIVWNAAGWLQTIPEVLALKERLQAGHFSEEDVLAARDAIGARIQTFLRTAQDPNPPPSGSQKPAEAPPEPTRPVPVSVSEQSIASVSAPPAAAAVPPGVSVPGDGVTLPRVLRVVPPTYTPEARRAKVEGVVVLMAVVRTHGAAVNISVEHSLDDRFGLDEQAVAAVRQWRFAPGERDGRPVPVLVLIHVAFTLP